MNARIDLFLQRYGWLLAWLTLLLLPMGRAAEIPVLIAGLLGIRLFAQQRKVLFENPAINLATLVFLAYWLPALFSALDAVNPEKSWGSVAAYLRFLPMVWFLGYTLAAESKSRQRLQWWIAIVVGLWTLDALVQAISGYSLAGERLSDRISGIFGSEDLKLGQVIAALSPIVLMSVLDRYGKLGFAIAWIVVLAAILLAGSRSAWVGFSVISMLLLWKVADTRNQIFGFLVAAGLAATISVLVLHQTSAVFAERSNRTLQALQGGSEEIDYALAGRLPIWQTSLQMIAAHPINGVGVRGFRYDYPEHAASDDPWVDAQTQTGAFHPHQIILEILTETGAIGLLCWLAALALLIQRWRQASRAAHHRALPYGLGLLAMSFPINTHMAFYSTFWGLLFWLMIVLFIAALAEPESKNG